MRRRSCDVEGIPVRDWESLDKEETRIRLAINESLQQIALHSAQVLCLKKQQDFARKRDQDMLHRGLKTLDKLDEAEAKEKEEKEVQDRAAVTSASSANPSWFEPLSEEQLNQLFVDFPEGTAE